MPPPAHARRGGFPILRHVVVILVLAAFVAPAAAPLASPAPLAPNPWLSRGFLAIAHQGGEDEAPSNTLYAFKTALAAGADVLEMDVHATADGHLVVLHDTTVDRTTNGAGRVDALTLAEVQALDAAYWWSPGCNPPCAGPYPFRGVATGDAPPPAGFAAEDFRIPTLREVLVAFPDVLLNIEIKRTAPDTIPYERALADLLREFGRGEDTIVVSFYDAAIELFRAHNLEVSTAAGTGGAGAFWASAWGAAPGAPSLHRALQVPFEFNGVRVLSRDFVDDAHANGLAVHAWTLRTPEEMREALCLGVDGIMTARPAVLADVLATWTPADCGTAAAGPLGWPLG